MNPISKINFFSKSHFQDIKMAFGLTKTNSISFMYIWKMMVDSAECPLMTVIVSNTRLLGVISSHESSSFHMNQLRFFGLKLLMSLKACQYSNFCWFVNNELTTTVIPYYKLVDWDLTVIILAKLSIKCHNFGFSDHWIVKYNSECMWRYGVFWVLSEH